MKNLPVSDAATMVAKEAYYGILCAVVDTRILQLRLYCTPSQHNIQVHIMNRFNVAFVQLHMRDSPKPRGCLAYNLVPQDYHPSSKGEGLTDPLTGTL